MHRQSVNSSNLKSVGYDSTTQILEIEFHHGGVYQYSGVSHAVFDGLLSAGSKGTYFHSHIKGRYPYRRI